MTSSWLLKIHFDHVKTDNAIEIVVEKTKHIATENSSKKVIKKKPNIAVNQNPEKQYTGLN